ncbi:MAG: Lrp/AsnC ligand binding domain-containing protein, partial [Desulfovibrionaceae bacterium]
AEERVGATDTGEALATVPNVLEVHYCAGQDSYLVKVRAANAEGLAETLARIGQISTVKNTNSTIVLRTVKETNVLPVPPDPEP